MIFDILYIDFPFKFNNRNNINTKFGQGVHGHYDTLDLNKLMNLKPLIDDITNKNTMIFSWASGALDHSNTKILESWGYIKITKIFTWIKISKDGKPLSLCGNYTGSNSEDVWLFRKPNSKPLPRIKKLVNQVIMEPRREHSRKPDIIRKNLNDIFGKNNKLELFGRIYDNQSKYGITKYIDDWLIIGKGIDNLDITDSLINCKLL